MSSLVFGVSFVPTLHAFHGSTVFGFTQTDFFFSVGWRGVASPVPETPTFFTTVVFFRLSPPHVSFARAMECFYIVRPPDLLPFCLTTRSMCVPPFVGFLLHFVSGRCLVLFHVALLFKKTK